VVVCFVRECRRRKVRNEAASFSWLLADEILLNLVQICSCYYQVQCPHTTDHSDHSVLCHWTTTFEVNNLLSTYLACQFILTLSMPSFKGKVRGQSSGSQDETTATVLAVNMYTSRSL